MTIRLLWLMTFLLVNQNVLLFAQSAAQRQQQQNQRYQQQQNQQQQQQARIQRQNQLQQRQQRLQQLQYKQQQLQQQRHTLELKQQAINNRRQAMTKPGGVSSARSSSGVRVARKPSSGQTASGKQNNQAGRNRALAGSQTPRSLGAASSHENLALHLPPPTSSEIAQAKIASATKLTQLRSSRASLMSGSALSSTATVPSGSQKPLGGGNETTRQTAKDNTLSKLPSSHDVLESALRPSRTGSQSSRALQALQKKIDNPDKSKAFSNMPKTEAQAQAIIKEVFDSPNQIKKEGTNRAGQTYTDVFDSKSGRGVRILKTTGEFDTFVNLQ